MSKPSQRAPLRLLKASIAVALAASAVFISGCGHHDEAPAAQQPLMVGVIPFEDAKAIKEGFTPLAEYLGKKTGRPSGQVFVTADYSGIIAALQTDHIDCAYLNPLSYVLAVEQFRNLPEHLVPVAMPWYHQSPTYTGEIFVRADSGIKSLKDLKGKVFVFGDRTSTSGYLYPTKLLMDAGLDPDKDIKAVHISGTHPVDAVFMKQADAGASFAGAVDLAYPDAARRSQIRVIAHTDQIPNGMFVVRGNVDPKTADAIKAALLGMDKDPEGQAALKAAKDDKFTAADDHAFDTVRKQAKILRLDLKALDAPK